VVARLAIVGRDIPWIADLSDPWADNPYAGTRGRLRQGLDPWLEARVLARADAIVTPTAALTQRVRTRMPRSRAGLVTIPNGYDETEFADLETPRPAADLHVVHVGSFYASRSPHVFLEAVRRAIARAPRPLERLRVTFYGYADDASRREIFEAQRSLGVPVAYEPFLERRRALAEMLGAGALLLVTDAGMAGRELVPLKTFEYLRAGRPILALVPEGEARNLLRRCGGAFCAEPEDPDAVAGAIVRLAQNDLPAPPDQNCVPEFEMGRLTARLVRVLEEIRERP
jgi:glycosyltransferase involved in cell wall biosynthesis